MAGNGRLEIPKGVIWPVVGMLVVGLATVAWAHVNGRLETLGTNDAEQGQVLQGTQIQLAAMEERLIALQRGQKGIQDQLVRLTDGWITRE